MQLDNIIVTQTKVNNSFLWLSTDYKSDLRSDNSLHTEKKTNLRTKNYVEIKKGK